MTKPAPLSLPVDLGPDRYWAVIKKRPDGFTLREILDEAPGVTRNAIRRYVVGLTKLGIVEITGSVPATTPNAWDAKVYRCLKPHLARPMVRDVAKPDVGRRLQQLWNAMRALPQFTVEELAVAASTDELSIKRGRAAELVHGLKRHGLVRLVQPKRGRQDGSTPAIYALARRANTGPKPPRISREKRAVFDANRRRWIGADRAEVSA